ncbi:DUF885 domain-containing protein [Sphaerisporangium sp. NPDC051011]|uniref:DUF885 domain-containing protein n=1 Tax=Sphaerisporangium sp. NPDC051011 TaxID=3155792 RepID=UPI0033F230A0
MAQQHHQADLAKLAEAYFAAEMTYDPFMATLLGVAGHAHRVPDPSPEAAESRRRTLLDLGRRLDRVPLEALTGEDRVTHRVLDRLIHSSAGELAHGLTDFAVSASVVAPPPRAVQSLAMTPVDQEGPAACLERLAALPGYFDAWLARYRVAAAAGRHPLRSGVTAAVAQLDGMLSGDLDADPLVRPLLGRPEAGRAQELVRDNVRPALARFRDGLAGLAERTRPDAEAGVCHVPGGTEGYADALARHTRPGLSAEDIHRIGLESVAELREELARLGGRVLGVGTPDGVLAALREDPALRFSWSAEIVALVEEALQRAQAAMPGYFRSYAIADCVTREIDPLEAKTAPLAYYQPPGPDGLPGTHWINTFRPETRFRYEYEALAFHESVPGHHLQLALAQTLTDLPLFRRMTVVGQLTAHMEGWGLYTERLADEMGLYSSDIARFGMLSLDAIRACRLVVDTGMHHLGWERERAIAYMRDNTATTEANIRNEIDRYLAWPGQATAYLIGRREILRQRERARAELGDRFDVRDFHHEVIGHGALPLGVLEELISEWIKSA